MNIKTYYKSPILSEKIQSIYDTVLEQWPVANEKKYLETRHGRTFVIAYGGHNNPPLILLHGSGSNSYIWSADAALYSKIFRVYAVDIPGEAGKSEEYRASWNSNDFSEWMEDIYANLKIKSSAVCGISLGGWIAAKWSIMNPGKVTKLILLCPSGFTNPRYSFFLKVLFLMFLGSYGLKKMEKLIFKSNNIDPRVSEYFRLIAKGFIPRQEVPPLFSDNEVRNLKMPVMYIGGDSDVLINNMASINRIKELLPLAETHLLKNTGHAVTGVSELIADFLTA